MDKSRIAFFLAVIAVAAIGYNLTICPTVEFIDSGELALVCKNLGIAHPTGYPLYSILGRLATIFLWGELVQKVNILSLIFTALASGFLFLLISDTISTGNKNRTWSLLISSSVSVFTSFTPLWWAQGTTNEVYSLNLLLMALSIWCLTRYLNERDNQIRWLILSAYALGLSLANHLSAVFLIPGYLYLIMANLKRIRTKNLITIFAFFIFSLTLYLLLPVRAQFKPFLNWGGVADPYFLFKHISGWQYRIWMFSDPDFGFSLLIGKIAYTGRLILAQFGWLGSCLALAGLIMTIFRNRRLSIFALLIIVFNFIYASGYQIIDIESYYLPMILILSIFVASALYHLSIAVLKAYSASRPIRYVLGLVILAFPLSNFIDSFFESDRSRKTFARQGVYDIVDYMEPGGLAIIENWDFYSPWLYFHFEGDLQSDRVLLDKELMRRSWYIDFIRRMHPEIYKRSEKEFTDFLRLVEPFERGLPFDPAEIDRAYYGMLFAIVEHEATTSPIYTNIVSDRKFISVLPLVPDGILFRVHRSDQFLDRPRFNFEKSYWGNRFVFREPRIGQLLQFYKKAFSARERYCLHHGKIEEAEYYRNLAGDATSIISELMDRES
jgi:hypothetical protein